MVEGGGRQEELFIAHADQPPNQSVSTRLSERPYLKRYPPLTFGLHTHLRDDFHTLCVYMYVQIYVCVCMHLCMYLWYVHACIRVCVCVLRKSLGIVFMTLHMLDKHSTELLFPAVQTLCFLFPTPLLISSLCDFSHCMDRFYKEKGESSPVCVGGSCSSKCSSTVHKEWMYFEH